MLEKLNGNTGASILAQIGFVLYLLAGSIFSLISRNFDPYWVSGLPVALLFAVLAWFSWKGKPWAYLASSVIGLLILLTIPITFSKVEEPVVVWEASLAATLALLVAIEGFLSYAGMKKDTAGA